ncbi:hypothetical protein V1520DRAFT_354381 [Lipomyces starkeyi]|uniref:Uncharacterized protein n=1 Tax=Lipomyces starkeyi NRRL Y-11557 TaxID=675824 RepID=A0A1E3PZW6_LIPST|nr:hypothetical protein LIPSTDRAFT_106842 [Lipomyces starkeyi NRRL Y-11557]
MVYPRRLIERQRKGLYISPEQQVQIDAYRLRERLRQRGIRNRRLSRASEHEHEPEHEHNHDYDCLRDPDLEQDLNLQSPATSPGNVDNDDTYQDSHDFATHTDDDDADCSAITTHDYTSDLSLQQSQPVPSVPNQIDVHDLLSSLNTDVDDQADDNYFPNTDTSLNSMSTNQDLFQLLEMTASTFHGLGQSSSACEVPAHVVSRQQIHTPSAAYTSASSEPSTSYLSNHDSSVSDSTIDAALYVMSAPSSYKSLDSVLSTCSFSNTPQDESDTEAEYTAGQSTAAYYTPRSDYCSLFTSTPVSGLLSVSTSPDLGIVDSLLWPDKLVEFDMVYPPSPALMLQRERRFSDTAGFFI